MTLRTCCNALYSVTLLDCHNPLLTLQIKKGFKCLSFKILRNIFWNRETDQLYKELEIMTRPDLAKTLHHLSLNGIKSFYSGSLMKQLVQTIQAAGQ